MSAVLKREAAFLELEALWRQGVYEDGRNNRGRMVDKITGADSLPGIGYAWCQSTMNYCWELANGESLAGGTASVGFFVAEARKRGWIVLDRPQRFDHICFHFNRDNWADHVAQIARVIRLGPALYVETIEGNTGPSGAVSDPGTGRDGIYRKRRTIVRRSSCVIIRVPGLCPTPSRYRKGKKVVKPAVAKVSQEEWLWRSWFLGEGPRFKDFGPANRSQRPRSVRERVPLEWWTRLGLFLERRKKGKK